jgi:16S rRNA (guanine527-N7)-methyltransferase
VRGTSWRRERSLSIVRARRTERESVGRAGSLPTHVRGGRQPPGCDAAPSAARRGLPTDAHVLPPLGAAFDAALDDALAGLGESIVPSVRRALESHARLLVAWNQAINLTAVRTAGGIALEHVADSLTALRLLRRFATTTRTGRPSLLDLGSGPGYPGLPLAVALPVERAALVDSVGKKQRFLAVAAGAAVRELEVEGGPPPRIEALRARAEELARTTEHREAWDVVVVRAVASFAELVELALPLLRVGGQLIAWKRDDGTLRLAREIADGKVILGAAGGAAPTLEPVRLRGLEDHRLVVVGKVRTTPRRFPRASAERRRPLLP